MTKSNMVRESVINGYLNGKSFDEISNENSISKGGVHNFIRSWIAQIGIPNINELREFSVIIRKSGITIKQCAQSFRFIQILANFGIKDEIDSRFIADISSKNKRKNNHGPTSRDDFYYFIEFIYNNCKNLGIKSTDVVGWMQDLIDFSSLSFDNDDSSTTKFERDIEDMENLDNNKKFLYEKSAETRNNKNKVQIPFISKLSSYIEQKKLEGQNLDINNKELQLQIGELEERKNSITSNITNLKRKESSALTYLDWFNSLKEQLWDIYSIELEKEYTDFVKIFNDFKYYDYNAHQIVNEYRQLESLRNQINLLQGIVNSIEKTRNDLLIENASLEQRKNYSKQSLDALQELRYAGFGLKELKQLKNTISEIATVNDISWFEAGEKFIKDIESQYDSKLGFETKIANLKTEKKILEDQVPGYKEHLQSQVNAFGALQYLYEQDVTDDDIINTSDLVMAYVNGKITFKPKEESEKIVDENKYIKKAYYWKLFINEIKNLGDINSQIENQRSYLESIKKEIEDLNSQRQKLNEQTLLSGQILNTLTFRLSSFMEFFKQIMHPAKDVNNMLIVYQPLFFINVTIKGDPKDDNNINTNN